MSNGQGGYAALCFGGPLDGQIWVSPDPALHAVRHKSLSHLSAEFEANAEAEVSYYVDEYRWSQFCFGPMQFPAWVILHPLEHHEAEIERIEQTLSFLFHLTCLLNGDGFKLPTNNWTKVARRYPT